MNFKKNNYDFLTLSEKYHIEDFLDNREIEGIARKKDMQKALLQFFFFIGIGGIHISIIIFLFHETLIGTIAYAIIISTIIMLAYLIIMGRLHFKKISKDIDVCWKYLFNTPENPIILEEDIKKLRKKEFFDHITNIFFIKNQISLKNKGIGAEILTMSITTDSNSTKKEVSNYAFLYKFQLEKNIPQKIQIIKIRDGKKKNFFFSFLITSIFSYSSYESLEYLGIVISLIMLYGIYKGLCWMSGIKKKQGIGNKVFDKKYIVLGRKSGFLKNMIENKFFDELISLLDSKITYEIYIEGTDLYIKIDFLRSHISRMNFIYLNIFNFRTYRQTFIDTYIDSLRVEKIRDLINKY